MAQAHIIDKAAQCSFSASLGAPLRLPKAGWISKNSRCCPSRRNVVFATVSRDLKTKEPEAETKRSQNGASTSHGSQFGQRGGGKKVTWKASVTIGKKKRLVGEERTKERMDIVADILGKNITLQLVSLDIDPVTNVGKRSAVSKIYDWAEKAFVVAEKVQYSAEIVVDANFGTPGAVIVVNEHRNEIFLDSICLTEHEMGTIDFVPHSWVHSVENSPNARVFFSNQAYLPSSTPDGLHDLREQDLQSYRGDGHGVRQVWENIYDYEVYNDLCDVDKDANLARSILGGSKEFPYPRRNRTGRAPAKTDNSRESRIEGHSTPYVPRDEAFEHIKTENYLNNVLRGLIQQKFPDFRDHFMGRPDEFDSFDEIDRLYVEVIQSTKNIDRVQRMLKAFLNMPISGLLPDSFRSLLEATAESPTSLLRYPQPQILSRDKFSWLQDVEFGRQCLAGLHPCAIQRLKAFPIVSALDNPELYGSKESAIQAHHIQGQLEGLSVEEALDEGKLFILDYHDIFIPYINRINALGDRVSYASRSLFFLTSEGTLKPLAIELSLPPPNPVQQVFVPATSATKRWLWKLAKAHVDTNDAAFHQVYSHWIRTHAATEPYSIALNRNLSPMHPIYKLIHPHLRYTMEINAAARQSLISAGGIIEGSFLPGKYSMEIGAVAYGLKWRFDEQSLPSDLISRGVAVEDPSAPHGLKLLIEDYPFANDGLLIWSSIESWVTEYVSIYYKTADSILEDEELQKWWTEVRTRGHPDKKDERWWPQLQDPKSLVQVLSTIMWVASGLHAAVNFGQFGYAGFVPNKPTLMRKLIPQPDTPEYKEFLYNPQHYLLSCLPSQIQSTTLMAVLESLSTHSPDEEYLGMTCHPRWFGCQQALEAFKRFQQRLCNIEAEIHSRNENPLLSNRNGAGVIPYELLLPTSKPGITGRGVPNSVSI